MEDKSIKDYIIEDVNGLPEDKLHKLYKYIRTNLVANINDDKNLTHSEQGTVRELIRTLQGIDEEYKDLPISIIAENGLWLTPVLKAKKEFFSDPPKGYVLTW